MSGTSLHLLKNYLLQNSTLSTRGAQGLQEESQEEF